MYVLELSLESGVVAHACNPNLDGGQVKEDCKFKRHLGTLARPWLNKIKEELGVYLSGKVSLGLIPNTTKNYLWNKLDFITTQLTKMIYSLMQEVL